MNQQELLNEQNFVNQQPKNTTILKRTKLDNSPFTIIEKENIAFLSLKNYRVTEEFQGDETYTAKDALLQYIETAWMDLMTRTMVVMYQICKEADDNAAKTLDIEPD